MNCDSCKAPTISLNYVLDTRTWVCKTCYEAPPLAYSPDVQVTIDDGKHSVTLSTGHLRDIRSRRISPDGEFYCQTGTKTYFTK